MKNDGSCVEHPNREKIWAIMLINLHLEIDIDKGII
jgi:hypothetical protein